MVLGKPICTRVQTGKRRQVEQEEVLPLNQKEKKKKKEENYEGFHEG